MVQFRVVVLFAIVSLTFMSRAGSGQEIPGLDSGGAALSISQPVSAVQVPPEKSPLTIGAGTRVLMVLTSPLHTTSGVEGSGVYLETLQPVIQDSRIVIPAHTQVQGVIETSKRPGHFRRTAEFKLRFTTLIFPNNHVANINGALRSIPGSPAVRISPDDGKLKTVDQIDRAAVAGIAGATGGVLVGSVSRVGIGKAIGAGLGAGVGLETVLLQKGNDIVLGNGTQMEMILESPFILDPEQAAFNATYVPPRAIASASPEKDPAPTRSQTTRRRAVRPGRFPGLLPWF